MNESSNIAKFIPFQTFLSLSQALFRNCYSFAMGNVFDPVLKDAKANVKTGPNVFNYVFQVMCNAALCDLQLSATLIVTSSSHFVHAICTHHARTTPPLFSPAVAMTLVPLVRRAWPAVGQRMQMKTTSATARQATANLAAGKGGQRRRTACGCATSRCFQRRW
jgi:hypothetical protein